MERIVTKFGGSSLADATQFQKVRKIVQEDCRRSIVVPSAPGRRYSDDEKITDLLYECYTMQQEGKKVDLVFNQIRDRYCSIAKELQLSTAIESELEQIKEQIEQGASREYCASRGEYLNGLLLSDYLGFEFLDAAKVIFFLADGTYDEERTNRVFEEELSQRDQVVVPGFYGSMPDGSIQTFSRGGSDITGAIAARAAKAVMYENWTDVSGVLKADPRIVSNPKKIDTITYRQLYELSSGGASVLHQDTIFPVLHVGIPINIRNTNQPTDSGTIIYHDPEDREPLEDMMGVTGRNPMAMIELKSTIALPGNQMRTLSYELGRALGVAKEFVHVTDKRVYLTMDMEQFASAKEQLQSNSEQFDHFSVVQYFDRMALVRFVGKEKSREVIVEQRIQSLLQARCVDTYFTHKPQGSTSILIGVNESHYFEAINAIYEEFAS